MDSPGLLRRSTTKECVEQNTGEGDRKVRDDLDRNREGPRLCGVVGYCWQPTCLDELKVKKKRWVHWEALISVSPAISQTPAYTARPHYYYYYYYYGHLYSTKSPKGH